ncbi:MAG: hypothetical protein P8177_12090 [Gemmatimonadota bacterium]
MVEIPDPGPETDGVLRYRRYPTADDFTAVPMVRAGGVLRAALPRQPAAGKLEYHVVVESPAGTVRLPARGSDDPIIRFKDPVPVGVLIPHVAFMFFAILVGVRAGLGAAVGAPGYRGQAWTALVLMTIGGLVLGPIVQEAAFGAYWTGFPFGYDLTDNKTLILWLVWVVACAAVEWGRRRSAPGTARVAIVAATVVMLTVYLVPHSLRGSELDYDQLEQGVDPAEAIRTGAL